MTDAARTEGVFKVLVSVAKKKHLSDEQQRFLQALTERIRGAGLEIGDIDTGVGIDFQVRQISRLSGVLVVAFAQWTGQRPGQKKDAVVLPTEFNHVNIAIAAATGRPLLVVKEKNVAERGGLKPELGCRTIKTPNSLNPSWLDGDEFGKQFDRWTAEVRQRRDVFLGYCSKSGGLAAQVQIRLERLGATVHNWAMDFRAGASILGELEQARQRCRCGVFLFTEDDPLKGAADTAAPRDNVVFEAGFFISAKGAERCLIIRQGESKMPADLGGGIYVELERGAGVESIEGRLASFLHTSL